MLRSPAPNTPPTAGRDVELLRAMLARVDQHDPGAFNNLGVLYHTRGLHAEAVEAFRRALAIDPRMRTAARNLEIAAAQPGACEARLAELASRLATDPDDREALLERARLSRLMGRREAARHQLDALIAEDPDDAAALFERALVEQREGDLRKAQRWLERAVNAGAGHDAALLLAEVLYQRGQNEQALEAVEALLVEQPALADAHRLRGFVLGDMGHHDEALAAARQAAALNPALDTLDGDLALAADHAGPSVAAVMAVESEATLAHYGLGLAFRQRGYFREARREFDRAAAQGEDARLVSHALAELDLIDGDAASARARYRALLDQEETARWWNEHGVACHQAGDLAAAAESYRRALFVDARDALAYNNLGVALADTGDAVAAREAFTRAAELEPALVLARLNLARALAQGGEVLAALSLLKELVMFRPREADAWHTMGVILVQRQRPADAREAFLKAIEQRPTHAEARFALAQVLADLGDHEGAARETQQALGIASYRAEVRLAVGIALQLECPDAVGAVDLLRVAGGTPLAGVPIEETALDTLLPEAAHDSAVLSDAERAARSCEQADDFAMRTLHGEAVERYREARERVEGQPAHAALWRRAAVGEARSLCLLQRAHLARRLLETLVAETPDDPEVCALHAAALLAAEEGRDMVRGALFRVLRQDVASAALLHFAGDVALGLDDSGLAMAFFRRALALDPSRPSPRVAIARLLRERGDLLAARLELVAALTAAPEWRDALLELARLHREAHRLVEARQVLVGHLARVPTDIDALALLAEVLVYEERDTDARIVVDRVLRHDPANGAARWYDGLLHVNRGRLRDAQAQWMSLASDDAVAPTWRGRAKDALARLQQTVAEDETSFVHVA
ncbi:MAG: tetratricopeptide repeat protein [Gemmatimonadaceae bacterium]|nr:tetratricopeptide repeat protein [Gemmatimonadaceae bacterium]